MRAVKCVVGSYGAVMEDTECNAATRPTDTQVRWTSRLLLYNLYFNLVFVTLPCCEVSSFTMVESETDLC